MSNYADCTRLRNWRLMLTLISLVLLSVLLTSIVIAWAARYEIGIERLDKECLQQNLTIDSRCICIRDGAFEWDHALIEMPEPPRMVRLGTRYIVRSGDWDIDRRMYFTRQTGSWNCAGIKLASWREIDGINQTVHVSRVRVSLSLVSLCLVTCWIAMCYRLRRKRVGAGFLVRDTANEHEVR
jgi:hypothetical protein